MLVSVAGESGLLPERSYPIHICSPGPGQGQGDVRAFASSGLGIKVLFAPNLSIAVNKVLALCVGFVGYQTKCTVKAWPKDTRGYISTLHVLCIIGLRGSGDGFFLKNDAEV